MIKNQQSKKLTFISTFILIMICCTPFTLAEEKLKTTNTKDKDIISDIETTGVTGVNDTLELKEENITDKVKNEIKLDENTNLKDLIDINSAE